VTCTATDACGQTATCFFDVTVLTPEGATEVLIGEVEDLVDVGTLNEGQGKSLVKKLNATLSKLGRGRTNAACNQLQDFINQVTNLVGEGVLTPSEGQELIDSATNVRNALEC
jgi:hypothetical protein